MKRKTRIALIVAKLLDSQLEKAAQSLQKPIQEIQGTLNSVDSSGKSHPWILRLWSSKQIRLPEDGLRVRQALNDFERYKRYLSNKDLFKYQSLHALEEALAPYLQGINQTKEGLKNVSRDLSKATLLGKQGPYSIYSVGDEQTLKDIGEGTKWCTRGSYGQDCQAESYLSRNGHLLVIMENGKQIGRAHV